jgi:hypothetical protein
MRAPFHQNEGARSSPRSQAAKRNGAQFVALELADFPWQKWQALLAHFVFGLGRLPGRLFPFQGVAISTSPARSKPFPLETVCAVLPPTNSANIRAPACA